MKKIPLLLCIILLLMSADALCFTKEISGTLKRPKSSRIELSQTSSSPRARSAFQQLQVFQFEDRLEIVALYPFTATIEITNKESGVIYKEKHSFKQSKKITVTTNNYEAGNYSIDITVPGKDVYSGCFSIE